MVGDGFTVSRDPIQKPGNGKERQGKDEVSCTCMSQSNTILTPLLKSNQQSNNDFLSRENLNRLYHQLLQSINPLREPSKQLASFDK